MQWGDVRLDSYAVYMVVMLGLLAVWGINTLVQNMTIWLRGYPPPEQTLLSSDDINLIVDRVIDELAEDDDHEAEEEDDKDDGES